MRYRSGLVVLTLTERRGLYPSYRLTARVSLPFHQEVRWTQARFLHPSIGGPDPLAVLLRDIARCYPLVEAAMEWGVEGLVFTRLVDP